MKLPELVYGVLTLPIIRWFVPKRWLSMRFMLEYPEDIEALHLKTYNETVAMIEEWHKMDPPWPPNYPEDKTGC